MLTDEQMDIVDAFFKQIQEEKDVSLHQVSVLLGYALQGVRDRADLSDGEKLTVREIRKLIKGL